MAKKKAADATTTPKATKKKAAKKAATKAAAPAVAKQTVAKKGVAQKGAAKKGAAKKAALLKLTDKQRDLLTKVRTAGESGYADFQKAEQRSLDSLKEKKLLKVGKKDKATGKAPYHITKSGEKHLAATPTGA